MKDKEEKRSFNKNRKSDSESPKRKFESDKPGRRAISTDDREGKRKFEGEKARKFDRERKFDGERKRRFDGEKERKFDGERKRTRRDVTAESEILSDIISKRKQEGRPSPRKRKVLSLEYEEQYLPIRLNKYIANAGVCSRREADVLIQTGAVTVNGVVVTELGTKVLPTDEVRFGDRILQREKPVYLLLNKPKDYITTMEDDRDRKHVMQLVRGACKERIYPVGRLDRNTTGLLLFTNDGELTKKLTHPKHVVQKTYYVELNRNLSFADFEQIVQGLELEDGVVKVDEISYVDDNKRAIGITIHSGRNRIVRRIFEHLGYEVIKLDRVVFAGLTKKDLPRGKWRWLTEAEINILKMTIK
ncbi:MAG TPA: pseudouridine synthase [Bacteroidales bacterium]|nr:pseudouridine synthase [Bacteroidales bacterium]HPZ03756.1 pseudouridine synthase [Bacteroidales bacterium]HQB75352.1 pseudouridine synthase [Bacteroidales bacterium]HQQ21370.1 pseudouridine synthase [Bacteroidales bacterium]